MLALDSLVKFEPLARLKNLTRPQVKNKHSAVIAACHTTWNRLVYLDKPPPSMLSYAFAFDEMQACPIAN
jgi:hypothetical protein